MKMSAKTRHASILKTVVAKNICVPFSASICWPINTAITTTSVRPERKKNTSQKWGINKLAYPLLASINGGTAKTITNNIKNNMWRSSFNFLLI